MALLTVIFAARHFDRAEGYQHGRDAVVAEISNRLEDGYIEQAKTAREAEQKVAAALADRQTKLEKEKENAKQTVTAIRFELDHLQQHAKHQSSVRNMPATATTAAASDGAADSYGWQLFGKCAAEYAELAETADGQAAGLKEWQAYGQTVVEQPKQNRISGAAGYRPRNTDQDKFKSLSAFFIVPSNFNHCGRLRRLTYRSKLAQVLCKVTICIYGGITPSSASRAAPSCRRS